MGVLSYNQTTGAIHTSVLYIFHNGLVLANGLKNWRRRFNFTSSG